MPGKIEGCPLQAIIGFPYQKDARFYRLGIFLMFSRPATRYTVFTIAVLLLLQPITSAQQHAVPESQDAAYQKALEKEAALNLYRLKRSIEKDGFYSARIALNIWQRTSTDAGTFDPVLYEELKTRLYEKAMADSLACYQYFIRIKDANNAKTCMLIWKSQAKEIDRYDPEVYQELQEGIKLLKDK